MAKYACPFCISGYAHTSGEIPNRDEWLLWSAEAFDAAPHSIETEKLYAVAIHLYKCTKCSAVAIFWKGHRSEPSWYLPAEQWDGTLTGMGDR